MKGVKNQKKICVVPNCTRRSTPGNELSFHSFPRQGQTFVDVTTKLGIKEKVDRHFEWLKRLRISHYERDMCVCSQHFMPTDYFLPEMRAKTSVLKINAVPSRNLPPSVVERKISASTERRNAERLERYRRRQKQIVGNKFAKQIHEKNTTIRKTLESSPACVASTSVRYKQPQVHLPIVVQAAIKSTKEKQPLRLDSAEKLLSIYKNCGCNHPQRTALHLLDRGTKQFLQKQTRKEEAASKSTIVPLTLSIESDDALSTMCGIHSHTLFNKILSLFAMYYPDNESEQHQFRDYLILTAMKLKTNVTFASLAIIFQHTDGSVCRRIFIETLKKLSTIMRTVVQWLPNEEIRKNVPKSFEGFENTIVVVDSIEIAIKKPNCSDCQTKTYSPHKFDYTAKFMIGLAPSGVLTFINEAYGGQASDKLIFEKSKMINRINRDEAIMIGKGFTISDCFCKKHGVQLFRPLFSITCTLLGKKPLSMEEKLFNNKIANARIYVDRTKQRIWEFGILKYRIPNKLLPYIEDIFFVCCAFSNLEMTGLGN